MQSHPVTKPIQRNFKRNVLRSASGHCPRSVAAGLLACCSRRHPCRPGHKTEPTSRPRFHIRPPGWTCLPAGRSPGDTAARMAAATVAVPVVADEAQILGKLAGRLPGRQLLGGRFGGNGWRCWGGTAGRLWEGRRGDDWLERRWPGHFLVVARDSKQRSVQWSFLGRNQGQRDRLAAAGDL